MATEVELERKHEPERAHGHARPGPVYRPPADVYETADAVVVTMDVPGVRREDLDLRVEKDVLSVTGTVDTARCDGLVPLYTERDAGDFARSFALSSRIDRERIEAKLENGVLTITLPKADAARARRIVVH